MLAGVLHGIVRVALLEPYTGDFKARQIMVFIDSAMILAITAPVQWICAANS